MKTLVMLSNHHVHLTDEACHALFGDKGLTFARYLAEEGGPWSSNELVEVRGPRVRLADSVCLALCAPIRRWSC